MKIIGITYCNSIESIYLKPDAALVVNNKPFFLPNDDEFCAHVALVAKINRLGRQINTKFANRYFDQISLALNIVNRTAMLENKPDSWVRATAFDNSFVVGEFIDKDEDSSLFNINSTTIVDISQSMPHLFEAISKVSELITIRMGDMVAVDLQTQPIRLLPEQLITINQTNKASLQNKELLYCKIK